MNKLACEEVSTLFKRPAVDSEDDSLDSAEAARERSERRRFGTIHVKDIWPHFFYASNNLEKTFNVGNNCDIASERRNFMRINASALQIIRKFARNSVCDNGFELILWQVRRQIEYIALRPAPRGFGNEKKHLFRRDRAVLIDFLHNAMIRQMTLVPKREYVVLLAGDVLVFVISLWLALALRYLEVPNTALFERHLTPFIILFIAWAAVFFLAGLYGKHTRLFRNRLPSVILYAQAINVSIAALFFFLIPAFGLAPKTILLLYLTVSCPLIFYWRVKVFSRLRSYRKLKGVLIASGSDARELAQELTTDSRYQFEFKSVIDTEKTKSHDVVEQACRVAAEKSINFFVVDFADKAISTALPIVYNAAFQKRRFALVDAIDLYQEVFDRMPLSLLQYERVLAGTGSSRVYDGMKRIVDITGALVIGVVALIMYPFVALAIKLDDGGPVFITQARVGKYQKPIRIIKFRSMTGNDEGAYGKSGKTELHVTRVGYWLRLLRIDELPQLWNVLMGDLSLVGPRPELPALSSRYSARIPYYNARYLIAPGLTGWAQVRHDRDPHHGTDIVETKAKLSFDLYYLAHRSLLLDIFILLQTIRIFVTARGS